jgi:hypothetical protein
MRLRAAADIATAHALLELVPHVPALVVDAGELMLPPTD